MGARNLASISIYVCTNNNTMSSSSSSATAAATTGYQPKIRQKVLCVILLVVAILTLGKVPDTKHRHKTHWAVWAALLKHPPSLRIFRSLLEWNLLLWGAVLSLHLWYKYIGKDLVGELLFAPAVSHSDYRDHRQNGVWTRGSINMYEPMAGSFKDLSTGCYDWTETGDSVVNTDFATNPYKDGDSYKDQTREVNDELENENEEEETDSDKLQEDNTVEIAEEEKPSPVPFDAHVQASHPPKISNTAGATLDMLLPILIALFLFTFLSTTATGPNLKWIAPIVPLVLVLYLTFFQLLRPWKQREHFFTVISWTMGAPLFPVTFRDGFIGDIFTSTVRPLQDVAFTLCYIFSGLQGYWSYGYEGFWDSVNNNPDNLNDDDDRLQPTEPPHSLLPPLETSWFLHTVLLPMCMVSPLWWRFLQNLRQSHDTRRRWPYLGNAFKYLLAAEVAMFGVFDPSKQKTWHWLSWFAIATLYQVWWDIFMDWDLLVPAEGGSGFYYKLRDNRLFSSKAFYMFIMGINVLLRFCWTLSFLPPRYLNQAGVLSDTFQHSDWSRALAPAIASAEIVRRTMWGWLRLENEAVKVKKQEQNQQKQLELQYRGENPEEAFEDILDDLQPMSFGDHNYDGRMAIPSKRGIVPMFLENAKTMEYSSEIQVLAELTMWATLFAMLGLVAAAHRMTL